MKMEGVSKLKLERTLSIQSCFPELNSGHDSSTMLSEIVTINDNTTNNNDEDDNNNNINNHIRSPHHIVSLQLTYNLNEGELVQKQAPAEISPTPLTVFTSAPAPSVTTNKSATTLAKYVPLYQAALKGDWESAKNFFALYPDAVTARITKGWERVLHIAVGAKQIKFIEELVKLMDPMELALQNKYDNTALCFAAATGIKRIAEVMVAKNMHLPMVRGSKGVTPLHMAALLGYRDMVWYLYSVTDSRSLTKEDYIGLLIATISSDLYDVALDILQHQPELATARDPNGESALHVLARKHSVFSSRNGLGIWKRCIYPFICVRQPWDKSCCVFRVSLGHDTVILLSCLPLMLKNLEKLLGFKDVYEKKLMHLQALELLKCIWKQVLSLKDSEIGSLLRSPSRPLFIAAECGNFEFIVELIRSYPDLIWKVDEQSRSIFHTAVIHRQEKIFKLLYDIGAHKDLITSYKSTSNRNILHLAAKLAPSNRLNIVSGAALQMQRELLWFKEVEKNVQPLYKEMRNSEGQTPRALFSQDHKGLVKAGERWMKDTSSSCMLVATLITTVMFAAIFTVPGGNNNNSGIPIFLNDKSFFIFSISDALALFSSVTSILMFLSILTSRYAEEDFLESLPKRLIIGLPTLFFSIVWMLVAFSASFFIMFGNQRAWIIVPVALTACVPVTLFAFLQFPLLADMIRSTYGAGIFARDSKDRLYY